MANQLKEEIVLSTQHFDKKIEDVIRKVENLKKKGESVGNGFDSSVTKMIQRMTGFNGSATSLLGTLGKMGGIFGVAFGAGEIFNRMLSQSQTVGDGVVRVQTQASEAVNFFATSLARADFSHFLSGLQNIIAKAGEVADVLDDLQSRELLFSGKMKQLQSQYNRLGDIARDPTRSIKERKEALEAQRKLNKEMTTYEESISKVSKNYAYSNIRKELDKYLGGTLKVGDKAIDWMFDYSNYDRRNQLGNDWKRQRDEAQAKIAKAESARRERQEKENQNYVGGNGRRIDYTAAERKDIADAQATIKRLAKDTTGKLAYAAKEIDDSANSELKKSIDALSRSADLQQASADRTYQENRTQQRIESQSKTSGSKTTTAKTTAVYRKDVESVDTVIDRVQSLHKQLATVAPDTKEYKTISKEIERWQSKLEVVGFDKSNSEVQNVTNNVTKLSQELDTIKVDSKEYREVSEQVEKWKTKLEGVRPNTKEYERITKEIETWKTDISTIKYGDSSAAFKVITDNVKDLQSKLDLLQPNTVEFESVTKEIEQWKRLADTMGFGEIDTTSYKAVTTEIEKWKVSLNDVGFNSSANDVKGIISNIEILTNKLADIKPNTVEFKIIAEEIEVWKSKLQTVDSVTNTMTIKDISDNVTVLTKKLQTLKPNTEEFAQTSRELEKWKQRLDEANNIIDGYKFNTHAQTIEDINSNISILQSKLQRLNPNTVEFENVAIELDKWQDKLDRINDVVSRLKWKDNATTIKDVNGNIAILQSKLNDTVKGTKEWLSITKQIESETAKLNEYQSGSIADLQAQLARIEKALANENLTIEARLKLIDSKTELQAKIDSITDDAYIKVTPQVAEVSRKQRSISNAQTNISNIEESYYNGLLDYSNAKAQIEAINNDLQGLGLKPIKIHLQTDAEKALADIEVNANAIVNGFDGIDGIVSSFENLANGIENGATAWETFMGILQTGTAIIKGVSDSLQAVNTITDLFGNTSVAASTQAAAASQVEATAAATNASAKASESVASATASGAKLPFPANLVAIAAGIAAVVSALKMMGTFANGGVIGGSSYAGDNLIARVNSGEMILNGSQQKRLFDIMDGKRDLTTNNGGSVQFVVHGKDLVGVLSNYNKVTSKLK